MFVDEREQALVGELIAPRLPIIYARLVLFTRVLARRTHSLTHSLYYSHLSAHLDLLARRGSLCARCAETKGDIALLNARRRLRAS